MWLILFLLIPDVQKLGDPEWRVREKYERLYTNPISGLVLPLQHDDPEIDGRAKRIRQKMIVWLDLDPIAVEWRDFKRDFPFWFEKYMICGGTSLLYSDGDVFVMLRNDQLRGILLEKYPPLAQTSWAVPGPILPNEWGQFVAYLNHYGRTKPVSEK